MGKNNGECKNMTPTNDKIAIKKGYLVEKCVACGKTTYYKYKKFKPLCPKCDTERRRQKSRDRERINRLTRLLKKEVNPFKTKLVTAKLNEIIDKEDVSRDELERIFVTYVQEIV